MGHNMIYNNKNDAYLSILKDVLNNPDAISNPRGLPVNEKFDYVFSISSPTYDAIITNDIERNKIIKSYTKNEFDVYNSLSNKSEDFYKISKFWDKIKNPDSTINSAYGYLIWGKKSIGSIYESDIIEDIRDTQSIYKKSAIMRTPWEWAKMSLIEDKYSRQAILRFSLPEHQWKGNKDQVCTMHGLFSIRDDKLNLTITMRSNDLVVGMVYDMPWFISLIYKMCDELKEYYPNLEIGKYTQFTHNIHIYHKDIDKVKKMIG